MRYLAIVQRRRFLGQQELQLLAKELGEYSWGAAQGEISSELVGRFSPGTLVIADVGANNQIQRIEDAADHIVALLQSFSRFSESFKAQVEEIESWKQSLIYQSQELSRREAELLVRAQELEMQLAQVGTLGPEEVGLIREAAEGDPTLSPTAIHTEQEWLRQRDQQIEQVERELAERRRDLETQAARLREQQEDLVREREALKEQLEQHSQQNQLSRSQIAQIQAYLQALYNLGEADEAGRLADDRLAWQTDWQAYAETLAESERLGEALAVRQTEWERLRADLRLRQGLHAAACEVWQVTANRLQQEQALLERLERSQKPVAAPTPSAQPLDSESIEQLQRQLREQQREYQQRASLVLQQEEELHTQEAHMSTLQERLAQPALAVDERSDLEEELEFEEQRCLILRESLSQQQQRLAIEQEKIDQQVARLQALVGTFESDGSAAGALAALAEHLREGQSAQEQRRAALDAERLELEQRERDLTTKEIALTDERQVLDERRAQLQQRLSELHGRQIELEKRQSTLDTRASFGEHHARPLLADLDGLLRNLQMN